MPEVVGTAFVRIRAITSGLAKDIEKDLKKEFSGVGKKVGDDLGTDMSTSVNDTMQKGIREGTGDIHKHVDPEGSKKGGTAMGGAMLKSFNKAIEDEDFKTAGHIMSRHLSDNFNATFKADMAKAIGDGDNDAIEKLLKRATTHAKNSGNDAGEGWIAKFRDAIDGDDTPGFFKRLAGRFIGEDDGTKAGTGFLGGLRRAFASEGGESGGEAAGFFAGGFKAVLLKAAVVAFPAVLAAGSALLQYMVSLVGQVGFLAQGVVGLGAAGSAALGAMALAALPLALAFKAPTPALEEFKKGLKDVGHQWLGVGAATQKTMLAGLSYAASLSTKLIPSFSVFGGAVGSAVSQFARLTAESLTSGSGLARMNGILNGSIPIIHSVLSIAHNLLDIFLNIWSAAIPAAQDFASSLSGIVSHLKDVFQAATLSGSLTETINKWYERGKLVMGALADIVVAIWNILKIGGDQSGSFFDTFDKFAEKFRAFTSSEEGKNKLANIFKQANDIAHEFNGLVTDIVKAIGSRVFDGEDSGGIVGFIAALRDIVPKVADFFDQLSAGGYGSVLTDLAKTIGELFKSLDAAGVTGPTLATFNLSLRIFTDILKILLAIPGFDVFISHLLGFVGALKALQFLTGVDLLGKLTGGVKKFIDESGGLKAAGGKLLDVGKAAGKMAAEAVAAFAKMIGRAVVATAEFVVQAAIQIGSWIAMAAAAVANAAVIAAAWLISIGPIALVVAAVIGLVVIIVKNWETIKNAVTTAVSFVINFVKSNWPLLLAIITGPFGLIVLAITKNWDSIKNVFMTGVRVVVDVFLGMVGSIIHAAASAFGWVPGIGGKLKEAAKRFDEFRDDVNRSLSGIKDKVVQVHIQQKDSGDFAKGGLHAMGGIFRRATNAIIGEDGVEALLPITKPFRMQTILKSNPVIAQAIMAAMPSFNRMSSVTPVNVPSRVANTTATSSPVVGQIVIQGATFEGASATATALVRELRAESFRQGK